MEKLNCGKTVVLVVDMINGFITDGAMASKNIGKIIDPIRNFIEKNNFEAVFIRDNHEEDAIEFKNFPKHCTINSNESEIVDGLKMENMTILNKNSVNAFLSEDFSKWFLDTLDEYTNYIVTGCCTDICVLNLALSLKTYFNENNIPYKVIVKKDLVETYETKDHKSEEYNNYAFKLLELNGVEII